MSVKVGVGLEEFVIGLEVGVGLGRKGAGGDSSVRSMTVLENRLMVEMEGGRRSGEWQVGEWRSGRSAPMRGHALYAGACAEGAELGCEN